MVTGLQNHKGVRHIGRHRVGSHFGGTQLGEHLVHFVEFQETTIHLFLHFQRLTETGTGNAQRVDRHIALIQLRDELGAQSGRQDSAGNNQHPRHQQYRHRSTQSDIQSRLVKSPRHPHHRVILMAHPTSYKQGDGGRHEGHR